MKRHNGANREIGDEEAEPHASLTPKQQQVLNLLLDHMTSKEIALALGISHHTVDQRIMIARKKLGANSRSELAVKYREMVRDEAGLYGQTVYEESYLAEPAIPMFQSASNEADEFLTLKDRNRSENHTIGQERKDIRVVPEVFEGRYGTLVRFGAILALTAFILLIGLAGLAMFGQLSEFFAS